jgi:hypothetical protein
MRSLVRVLGVLSSALLILVLTASAAEARSIRESSGYTGRHTHFTWAGPGVGLIAWGDAVDFISWTDCGSSTAGVTPDASWNSLSLHNGAELDMLFSVTRTDGRNFNLKLFRITDPQGWPGHPAFGGQFRATVHTPRGLYLKSGTVTTWIVNGGVPYPPLFHDTVRFHQWVKSC